MGSKVRYISTGQQLVDTVKALLEAYQKPDIMISGVWVKSLHKDIIDLIIDKQCSNSCKVIIPKLLFKGNISLTLMRNVCKAEGQVRVNNSVTNNLLIIGGYAFILSFSSRLNSLNQLCTNFECAVMFDDEEIVNELKEQLNDTFENSVLFRM
ncbi:MAG: hypothetical protein APF77_14640 [Clostridia bacterium BRH_c25]|nr:MAG: hypothetical protein APF77_14640 [Clostridia bacterium BRH_c25]